MSSWGVAIFSDDTASDIRDEWRDGLREGKNPDVLTKELLASYPEVAVDVDESKIFWLALAASQHETGHLSSQIREKALSIIETGGDIECWTHEEPKLGEQRKDVLERLATKLKGPQPKPKKLRPRKDLGVRFDVGDAILLKNPENDATAIGIVVAHHAGYPKGTVEPVVELLLWGKPTLPTVHELETLPTLLSERELYAGKVRKKFMKVVRPNMRAIGTATKKMFLLIVLEPFLPRESIACLQAHSILIAKNQRKLDIVACARKLYWQPIHGESDHTYRSTCRQRYLA